MSQLVRSEDKTQNHTLCDKKADKSSCRSDLESLHPQRAKTQLKFIDFHANLERH